MGMGARFHDYHQSLSNLGGKVIYLNDLDRDTDRILIDRLIFTEYNAGKFSMIPACQCGELNKLDFPEASIGDTCQFCMTEMVPHVSRKLTSNLWVRTPDQVDSFIVPWFVSVLTDAFRVKGKQSTIIHWLLDPMDNNYNDPYRTDFLLQHGVKRGINYFANHTDHVLTLLNNTDVFGYREERPLLYLVYQRHKELLFPKQLAMTDKSFNVVERTHLGNFLDIESFNPYLSAINIIVGLNHHRRKDQVKVQESTAAQFLFNLSKYYDSYIAAFQDKKGGEYRKQVYASRLPWTTRQLIVSISDAHDYDEMHAPWSASIPLFEHHLTNYMLKDGYAPNEIKKRILHAVNNYDPYIDSLFDRMFEETPHRTSLTGKPGLIILDNRNPTLKTTSIQCAYITKIKKDPRDITCGKSVLCLPGQNADFDGRKVKYHSPHAT